MKFKTLMTIKAMGCLLIGPVVLFLPQVWLDLLGVSFDSGADFMARIYGAAVTGMLIKTWFGRKAGASPLRNTIILDLFVYDLIGLGVTLTFLLSGTLNVTAWALAGAYLFFTLGFGYYTIHPGTNKSEIE